MQVRIPQLFEEIAANKPHGLQIDRRKARGTTATRRMITLELSSINQGFLGVLWLSLCNLCVLCVSVVN